MSSASLTPITPVTANKSNNRIQTSNFVARIANARKQTITAQSIATAPVLCELENFLNDINTLNFDNPLDFFRKNEQYKKLGQIVKFLYCLTATSVPSENLFSHAGKIATHLRNRLNPEILETCFFKG